MANREIYRGRLIDQLHLVVRDLAASRRFYGAALGVLNIPLIDGPDFFWADELFVSTKESPAAKGELTGRIHLAFHAPDRATVDRFARPPWRRAGRTTAPPGERPYHPGYYAAFALDPDGDNIEVVFHGPAQRSAEAIKIAF